MLELILENLESDNSRLKKESILKTYKDSEILKELLSLTLDPYKRFKITLKEKDINPNGVRTIEGSWKEFSNRLNQFASQTGVTDKEKDEMISFLNQHTPKSAEFYRRVINKDLRCGVSGKTVKKIFGKIIPEFSVQLAAKYDGSQSGKWFASPKMDGNRAVAIRNQDGWVLYSRSGQEWVTVPHINEELKKLDELGVTFCDGELYTDEFPFEKIQSALRSVKIRHPQAHLVKYFIFWAGSKDDFAFKKEVKTKDGLDLLDKIYKKKEDLDLTKLEIVPQYEIDLTPEIADEWNKKFVDHGFEGAMFRHGTVGYDYRRSPMLLKYKKFLEEDFECIGFEEGNGKNVGSLGAIVVKVDDKNTVQVGSGFSDEMRDKIWANKDFYLGKKAEVKFQELSKYGIPRFPIFLKWKLDR